MGYCRFVWECGGALPLVEIWSHEFVKKIVEYEVFIDPVEIIFFSRFLRLSVLRWCKDSQQIVMLW